MVGYYHHVRKAFDAILRYLDKDVGRPLLSIKMDNVNREAEDIITYEQLSCFGFSLYLFYLQQG